MAICLPSGSGDGTVRLWDVATASHRDTLTGHTWWVYSVSFSPDGSMLASGSWDSTVRLWDVATASHRDTLTGHTNWVSSVSFSPDSNMLASGSGNGTVRLWDVATASHRDTLTGHTLWVYSVSFSPDSNMLASGSGDNTVRLWDVATASHRDTLTGHTNWVLSISFNPDGNMLASGSGDGTVRLWDVATANHRDTLTGHTGIVNSVSFSPDGRTLASGGEDGTVRLWDIATANHRDTLTGHTDIVNSVSFSPDGRTLASGSRDGTVLLWQLIPTSAPITFNPDSVPDQTFVVNTPIEPLALPVATGGTEPYTYTLEPLPDGLAFDAAAQVLSGTPTTAGTTVATYTATDATGTSASLTFTIEVIEDGTGPGDDALDVNGDGQITVVDLAITALFYGTQVPVGVSLPADVNTDGVVDLADLTAVAGGIDAAGNGWNQLSLQEVELAVLIAAEQAAALEAVAGAPMRTGMTAEMLSVPLTPKNVADALLAAQSDARLQKHFAVLEGLLTLLTEMNAVPETTALLPNYPNPFNPETWIPYHLSTDAEVIVRIYDMRGASVRELVLGHQTAGVYESRGRAAYWDGRNHRGEPVASGVYFYTLTAGDFTVTRKLMIRK